MRRPLLILSLLLTLALPATSFACVAGMVFEKTVGDFKAEMSYDTYRIRPGQTVRFHFDLNNITHKSYGPGNPIDYDFVEATFRQGKNIVHQESIDRIDFGETAFDYKVPNKNADYVVDIRFVKDDEDWATLSLPVRVGYGSIWSSILSFGQANAGLLTDVTMRRQ